MRDPRRLQEHAEGADQADGDAGAPDATAVDSTTTGATTSAAGGSAGTSAGSSATKDAASSTPSSTPTSTRPSDAPASTSATPSSAGTSGTSGTSAPGSALARTTRNGALASSSAPSSATSPPSSTASSTELVRPSSAPGGTRTLPAVRDDDGPPESPTDGPGDGVGPSRTLSALLVTLIVVALVVAGVAGWQGYRARTGGPVANRAVVDAAATAEVVGQTREAVEKIFSYDPARLDDSVTAARTLSTGGFTDQYLRVFEETIRGPATQQQLRQTAQVLDIGVRDLDGDQATLMAMVQFSAQRTTTGQQTNAPGLLTLRMQRVDGRWKLATLEPLTATPAPPPPR